jgi:hypothetical protein
MVADIRPAPRRWDTSMMEEFLKKSLHDMFATIRETVPNGPVRKFTARMKDDTIFIITVERK